MTRSRPFLLAQLSDSHIGGTWGGPDPAGALEAVVDAVLRLPDRPDAVLMTGDLVDHPDAADYEVVREQLTRLDVPVVVLPGNHDGRDALRACFGLPGEAGDPAQHSVDLGPLRVVALDSTLPGEARGELDAGRLAWLDAELAALPDRPTVLALHHPPLLTGSAAWDAIGLPADDRRALGEVVARHPQVRRIVAGHVHRTIVSDLAGRAVLAIPSTYVQGLLDFSSDELRLAPEPPGFAIHALVDGQIASHVQPVHSPERCLTEG